jgi:hypothetical protein
VKKLVYDHIIRVTKEKNRTYLSIDGEPRREVKNGESIGLSRIVEESRWTVFTGIIYGKFLELRQAWRKKFDR